MKDNTVLSSAAIIYKQPKGKDTFWFLVKNNDESDWEIPRTIVRRGESSVRAVIRLTQEQASMRTRVIEEVGRTSSVGRVNGKAVTQKIIYYLLLCKDGGEILGFSDHKWLESSKAVKALQTKKEQNFMKDAKVLLRGIEKARGGRIKPDPDPEPEILEE